MKDFVAVSGRVIMILNSPYLVFRQKSRNPFRLTFSVEFPHSLSGNESDFHQMTRGLRYRTPIQMDSFGNLLDQAIAFTVDRIFLKVEKHSRLSWAERLHHCTIGCLGGRPIRFFPFPLRFVGTGSFCIGWLNRSCTNCKTKFRWSGRNRDRRNVTSKQASTTSKFGCSSIAIRSFPFSCWRETKRRARPCRVIAPLGFRLFGKVERLQLLPTLMKT